MFSHLFRFCIRISHFMFLMTYCTECNTPLNHKPLMSWPASQNDTIAYFFRIFPEHQPPYIIAVLPRYVEIRTFEPRLLVQSVELQRPRFITSAGWDSPPVWFYHLNITQCLFFNWVFCGPVIVEGVYGYLCLLIIWTFSTTGCEVTKAAVVTPSKKTPIFFIICFQLLLFMIMTQFLLRQKNTFISTISMSFFPLLSVTGLISCM